MKRIIYIISIVLSLMDNKIFETLRQKLRENDELSLDPAGLGTRAGCAESCFEAARVEISCQLAYRFNQALALAFLNAYDK